MKFLAIGDPHGDKDIFDIKVEKDIDAVLITGDLGKSDLIRKYHFEYVIKKGLKTWKDAIQKEELEKVYLEIINSSYEVLKYFSSKKPTFYVLGNLREIRTDNIKKAKEKYGLNLPIFEEKIKHLKNLKNIGLKTIKFMNTKITGVPFFESSEWIKVFSQNNKKLIENAKKEEPKSKKFLENLKKTDILLTHMPPYGVLDCVQGEQAPKDWIGKHAGNKLILKYIKKHQPKLVLCGHIHEAKGEAKIGKTKVINLGCCGDYKVIEV